MANNPRVGDVVTSHNFHPPQNWKIVDRPPNRDIYVLEEPNGSTFEVGGANLRNSIKQGHWTVQGVAAPASAPAPTAPAVAPRFEVGGTFIDHNMKFPILKYDPTTDMYTIKDPIFGNEDPHAAKDLADLCAQGKITYTPPVATYARAGSSVGVKYTPVPGDARIPVAGWSSPPKCTPEQKAKPLATCVCEIRALAAFGCKCGYIEHERRAKALRNPA